MEQAVIKSDKETIKKLKLLAGDKSLSGFLRDLANNNVVITTVAADESEIEALRKSVLKQIEAIKITQESINDLMKSLNFRIEMAFQGIKNEQDFNDVKDNFLAEVIPGYREVLMQNDASHGLKEQFDSYMDEDEPFDEQ